MRLLPLCLCLALAATMACQDYNFMFRPNQRIAFTTVREIVVANTDTDILFVIDNSGSMKEEQDNLRTNMNAFITELAGSENNYRVGVITTDVITDTDGGRLHKTPADLNGSCGGIANSPASPLWLERPTAAPGTAAFDNQTCRLIADFNETVLNVKPVDMNDNGCIRGSPDRDEIGDGREAGLEAARRTVLESSIIAFNRNGTEDFLREKADLALIFLTDEEDCSHPSSSYYPLTDTDDVYWCYDEINNAIPVEDYVDLFASAKSPYGERKVRAALIGGGILTGTDGTVFSPDGCRLDTSTGGATADCGCWGATRDNFACELLHSSRYGHPCISGDDCGTLNSCGTDFLWCSSGGSGSCDTHRCEALPATRYHDFIDTLGDARVDVGFPRGTFEDSICQANYSETLRNIARTVVINRCFNLETSESVTDPERVHMAVRITNPDGTTTDHEVPRLGIGGDCTSCAGACADGAWELKSPVEICLECGLKKEPGTDFVLSILNEIAGFDGGGGDP